MLAKLTVQSVWLGQLFRDSVVFHILLLLKFENDLLATFFKDK